MKKFIIGEVYEMRFIGDSDLKPKFKCTERTEKSVSFIRADGTDKINKKKIRIHDESEYIITDSYSMAPTIYAKNKIN